MVDKEVFFRSGNIQIEGLLNPVPGERGVVISHPHPLYGGSMHNPVVESVAQVYQQMGYATLRFNFRGVGRSAGTYDDGRGEQEDVKSALRYLSDISKKVMDLVGYSFGAWVNALSQPKEDTVQRVVMVSPPVAFLDFSPVSFIPNLKLVVAGNRDQIAPPKLIESLLPVWNPEVRFRLVDGADHFYGGHLEDLKHVLAASLVRGPS